MFINRTPQYTITVFLTDYVDTISLKALLLENSRTKHTSSTRITLLVLHFDAVPRKWNQFLYEVVSLSLLSFAHQAFYTL